jgi:Tol biopolymer transport system component
MDERPLNRGPSPGTGQNRLDSWKAIAAYLKRDVTTVQRWERRERMPVHRHLHDKQGSVYAFCSELDEWSESRRTVSARDEQGAGEQTALVIRPDDAAAPVQLTGPAPTADDPLPNTRGLPRPIWRRWLLYGVGGTLLAVAVVAYWFVTRRDLFWRHPLADARVTQLTDMSGTAQSAAISRDGRLAAFLSETEGHTDAWILEIASGQYRNLTQGSVAELINPSIRTLGFSPDSKLVTIWSRKPDGSRPGDINILAVPPEGGPLQTFLPEAAEVAWSRDASRLVYHTTAPGDPLFVKDLRRSGTRQIYVAPAGVHCHFPLWSADDQFIYFTRGVPPDDWDIWRIRSSGEGLERITSHHALVSHPVLFDRHTLLYLASDSQRAGPWLFAIDVDRRMPHRLNFGLEHYSSLDASADGSRLVATAASVHSSLSRLSFTGTDSHVVPLLAAGLSPRLGPDYLLYVTSAGGRESIRRMSQGSSRELWSTTRSNIAGGPSISADGRWITFVTADGERTSLFIMDSDGTRARLVTDALALRGNPAWSPDGQSIIAAAVQDKEPRLTRIPINGGAPRVLVSEYSLDPTWSPDGQFLLYSGADVGTTFAVRAVAADGRPYSLPPLMLSRGARRLVFWRDGHSVVVLRGDVSHKNFWLVDLKSGAQRQLGELAPESAVGDFDVSGSADEIVYDRVKRDSGIALIERVP